MCENSILQYLRKLYATLLQKFISNLYFHVLSPLAKFPNLKTSREFLHKCCHFLCWCLSVNKSKFDNTIHGYFKNHWTNDRLVCTHLNEFSCNGMVISFFFFLNFSKFQNKLDLFLEWITRDERKRGIKQYLNGSRRAKMKKSIPDMSLPWNS